MALGDGLADDVIVGLVLELIRPNKEGNLERSRAISKEAVQIRGQSDINDKRGLVGFAVARDIVHGLLIGKVKGVGEHMAGKCSVSGKESGKGDDVHLDGTATHSWLVYILGIQIQFRPGGQLSQKGRFSQGHMVFRKGKSVG